MLGVIVISIPLLIYIIGAMSVKRKDLTHPDEFFVAYRKVGVTAFSSSSIAYAFQVSTIYPFLLWGASNFYFVPAVNTICWGAGIVLFYLCFNRYKHFIGQDVTLHGFLGKQYGKSVRVIASYLTIIAFLGYAISETYFGSKVLLSIIEDRNLFYMSVTIALFFVYGYIAYGGQLSSIRTDQLQLVISYLGTFGLMLYLLFVLLTNGNIPSGTLNISFAILLVYIPIILAIRKLQFIRFSEENTRANKTINISLNSAIVVLLLSLFGVALHKVLGSKFQFNFAGLVNVQGFGIAGLLSLMLLPLIWQFVDLTNWQRLLAVKPTSNDETLSLHHNIRRGLIIYAIESPFTWIVFLFFGLLSVSALPNFTFQDLLIDIPKCLISSSSLIQRFFGYTFIVSVLAIMLSTVDSFLVGTIFTFVYDSNSKTRNILDSKNENDIRTNYNRITNTGRIFGLVAIVAGLSFFIIFDKSVSNGGELFINMLLAFYSAQLAFFPLVFGTLFLRRHPSEFWANASMTIGAIAGITLGIYAVVWDPTYAWYPILLSTFLSSLIFVAGLILTNFKNGSLFLRFKSVFTSIATHFLSNKFSISSFFVAIICSATNILGLSHLDTWKNWEICAFVATLAYTYYLYRQATKKGAFECMPTKLVLLFGSGPVLLFFLVLIGVNEVFHLFTFNVDRFWGLFILTIIALMFSAADYALSKHLVSKLPALSNSYHLSLKFSDLPVFVIFFMLTLYALVLNLEGHLDKQMDAFFGGAVAFQMMLSNLIWTFTDDAFLANNH